MFANFANVRDMSDLEEKQRLWLISHLEKGRHGIKGELAKYLGVRPDAITRITNIVPGKEVRAIKFDELRKMAEFFADLPPGLSDITPSEKIDLPSRPSRKFHVKEWRTHSEWGRAEMARAIGMDEADYGFRELNPHKFTIEEMEAVARTLKIDFDQLRFLPQKAKVAAVATSAKKSLRK